MNIMNIQLKWACRIENIGSGFYDSLSTRYKKEDRLSKILGVFSRDELRHGAMFRKGYLDECGKKLMVKPWVFFGKTLAFSQYLLPLKWKLRILSILESFAVTLMAKELRSGKTNRYRQILEKIKSDEERHAAFYHSLYCHDSKVAMD